MHKIGIVFGIAMLGLGGCQSTGGAVFNMVSGSSAVVGWYHSVDRSCQSTGMPIVTVLSGPLNGRISTRTGARTPNFPSSNPRNSCNTQRIPATEVVYTPAKGFVGQDSVTYRVIFPGGAEWLYSKTISVK
jgi:hypothetical protein